MRKNYKVTHFFILQQGLTICHELIHIMGCNIELSSEVNVGTRIEFSVPLPLAEKGHNHVAEELNFNLADLKNCSIRFMSSIPSPYQSIHDLPHSELIRPKSLNVIWL